MLLLTFHRICPISRYHGNISGLSLKKIFECVILPTWASDCPLIILFPFSITVLCKCGVADDITIYLDEYIVVINNL